MLTTTRAIVFSSVKYGDTGLIVKAYTASGGLKSYMLKRVLASKKGKLRTAYFQPLMQLEIVAKHRNKGTLEYISEVRVAYPYSTLHTDSSKSAMALFLAEMLGNSIREEESNSDLFHFLETSFQWLDTHNQIANFHLSFLLNLSRYLGFYPATKHSSAPYFDLVEGAFVTEPTLHPTLNGKLLEFFKLFLQADYETNQSIRIGKIERQALLQMIITYFEVHLQGFKKPRSLTILNEVFN